LLDKETGS